MSEATAALPAPNPESLSLTEAITEFCADMKIRNLRPTTIKDHRAELLRYERWLWPERLNWRTVTYRQLKGYISGKLDKSYQWLRNGICTLRVFYAWAVEEGYLSSSPAAGFRTPKQPKPLPRSLAEAAQMLSYGKRTVYRNSTGGPLSPSSLWKSFKSAREAAELPDMRFHDLRHTAATLMLAAGEPIAAVSAVLGHSSPAITARVYAHALEESKATAIAGLSTRLRRG